jgi:hypothetical protein
MFPDAQQSVALAPIHMREIKADIAHCRLVAAAMQTQPKASKGQFNRLALYSLASHLLHKLTLPAWKAVVKPG